MSLMSKSDALRAKAQQEGASELDLMRAALVESQERYNKQAAEIALMLKCYDKRLEALELAVRQSNEQKRASVVSALEKASEALLEPLTAKINAYVGEVDKATAKFQAAKEEDAENNRWENIKWGTILFLGVATAFALGGYIANVAWSAWYDVPEKLDALNNGIYQLLRHNGLAK
jgi:hypothetical protein